MSKTVEQIEEEAFWNSVRVATQVAKDKKANYWRGFRSACIVLAPLFALMLWALVALIDASLATITTI